MAGKSPHHENNNARTEIAKSWKMATREQQRTMMMMKWTCNEKVALRGTRTNMNSQRISLRGPLTPSECPTRWLKKLICPRMLLSSDVGRLSNMQPPIIRAELRTYAALQPNVRLIENQDRLSFRYVIEEFLGPASGCWRRYSACVGSHHVV